MDRITKSLIKDLLDTNDFKSEGEAKDFEKFVNYSVISNEYSKTFDLDVVTVGSGSDTGIDGVAIIVNGHLIESVQEVDDLLESNDVLDVIYLFTQAKTSPKFNGGEIGTFFLGIKDFFSENPQLIRNEDIKKCAELSDYIYSKASNFKKNPVLKLYYTTLGKWVNDQNLKAVIDLNIEEMENQNLYDKILFYPYGAKEVADSYRKTKETNRSIFSFNNRVTLPSITGISQAYIGLLPFEQFKNIICNNEGELLNVFEDNVRDFQGINNNVNDGIASTLKSEGADIFSVLNNGVTIVASKISTTGDVFTIDDYQIVNGCQTSNVLYSSKDSSNIDIVHVPIKIIATDNDEIKNRITLATNNQTPIKQEQLASLTSFQRSLEQYYSSYVGDKKLFYERRSKQYNSDSSVPKNKIITVAYQIKSFSAMFLNDPHNVTSFFGTIVRKLNEGKTKIFNSDHSYSPYYTSAYTYYKLESFFRKNSIDSSYKKVRFHILMLFRILNEIEECPPFNSDKKIEKYCNNLLKILNDDNKALAAFKECINVIDDADFDKADKQDIKLLNKTNKLLEKAKSIIDIRLSFESSIV